MTNSCWYSENCLISMNDWYERNNKGKSIENQIKDFPHLGTFYTMLNSLNLNNLNILDLGCGTALISEFCKNHRYTGADMQLVLNKVSKKQHPENDYICVDILQNELGFIKKYFDLLVLNAVIDVMENPIHTLHRILENSPKYVIIHRQKLTDEQTYVIKNPSYDGFSYKSIINRKEFETIINQYNYKIVKEYNLEFPENSFLLEKKKSWSLNEIDHKLATFFNFKENGKFIDCGANDGLRQSNSNFLEVYLNWTGILIEAIPEVYEKCIENRSRQSVCVNAAVVSDSYKEKQIEMIYVPECYGLMSLVNTDELNHLHYRIDKQKQVVITVPAYTLNDILQLNSGKFGNHYDLLTIDIEGYEKYAFKGINFDKWVIDYILVEELEENDVISDLLSTHYEKYMKISEHDYLYKRKI